MGRQVRQNSFGAGELSTRLYGRIDLERWSQGSALVENFIPRAEGGLSNRQGSEKLAPTKLADAKYVRLVRFSPSSEESYILEFGHEYLRILDDAGNVTGNQGATVAENLGPDAVALKERLTQNTAVTTKGLKRAQRITAQSIGNFTIKTLSLRQGVAEVFSGVPCNTAFVTPSGLYGSGPFGSTIDTAFANTGNARDANVATYSVGTASLAIGGPPHHNRTIAVASIKVQFDAATRSGHGRIRGKLGGNNVGYVECWVSTNNGTSFTKFATVDGPTTGTTDIDIDAPHVTAQAMADYIMEVRVYPDADAVTANTQTFALAEGSFIEDNSQAPALTVAIHRDNAGAPAASAAVTFDVVPSVSDLPDESAPGWFVYSLLVPSTEIFADNEVIYIVVTSATDSSNYHVLAADVDTSYTDGTALYYDGANWVEAGSDLCFTLIADTVPGPIEFVTPWTSALWSDYKARTSIPQISKLVVAQSIDVMTITDPTQVNVAYQLKRYANDDWTLDVVKNFVSRGEPALVEVTGGPIGSPAPLKQWTYVAAGIDNNNIESLPTFALPAFIGASISEITPVEITITPGPVTVQNYAIYKGRDQTFGFIGNSAQVAGAEIAYRKAYDSTYTAQLRYYRLVQGYPARAAANLADADARAAGNAAASSVNAGRTTFLFYDTNESPDYTDQPRQAMNPFAGLDGLKPACVAFFQQRLVFANLVGEPDTLFMSEVADKDNFQRSLPVVDDDAVKATLSGGLSSIRALVPLRNLVVFTSSGEYVIGTERGAVAPGKVDASPVSYWGSGFLQPLIIGGVILFKDRAGHIRELVYEQQSNDYPGTDVGWFASHLFKNYQVIDWCNVTTPDSLVWAVRGDGTLLSFGYVRQQNVAAWSRHALALDAEVMSVTYAQGAEGFGETIYLCVMIGNQPEIIRMRPLTDDSPFLDFCQSDTSVTPKTNWSGFTLYENESVTVVADDQYIYEVDVDGTGAFVLPAPHSKVIVGYRYTATVRTLPNRDRNDYTLIKAVHIDFVDTRGLIEVGETLDKLEKRKPEAIGATDPLTDSITLRPEAGWRRAGSFYIVQNDPLPCHITGVTPEYAK